MVNSLYMDPKLTHPIRDAGVNHLVTLGLFWSELVSLVDRLNLDARHVVRIRGL